MLSVFTRLKYRNSDLFLPLLFIAVIAFLPLFTQNLYILRLAGTLGVFSMLSLGLTLVTGFAGILDLGYVAFFGIGAYTYSLLSSYQLGLHLPFYISLPASGIAALISAFLIGLPTLNLKGDYLAIATLAYGQIFRLLVINLDRPVNLTNGPSGIVGIDPPAGLGIDMYGLAPRIYLISALVFTVFYITRRIDNSKYGRGWTAIKEDATAAASMGIDIKRYRLLALAYGAVIAGIAGCAFAMWQGAVFPQNFSTHELITVFCMVALGGTGSISGAFAGTALLVVLPELLRDYSTYRMLIYGALLVGVMRFRPQGLVPRRLRRAGAEIETSSDYDVPSIKGGSLRVDGLSVSFDGLKALDGISFDVKAGEVLGIIGPNGAGKTTLLNVISGIYKPAGGKVYIDNHDITGGSPYAISKAGIARTFQNIRLFGDMTVEENILVGHHKRLRLGLLPAILSLPVWRRMEAEARGHVREVLSFIGYGMPDKRYDSAKDLNYGDRRRVELARAIISNPKVLLLDEPAAGMTSEEIDELIKQIHELNKAGYTILLIEHHMNVIKEACQRVLVLDHGQELAFGPPESVFVDPAVIDAYLGSEEHRGVGFGRLKPVNRKPLLEIRDITASYGSVDVLKGIDLVADEGQVVCLVGSNAAGKTTVLSTIMGELTVKSGSIVFNGQRIDGMDTSEIAGLGIAHVPEGRRVFARLSVFENLELGAYTKGKRFRQNLQRVYELFPVLKERSSQKAGTLSGGEQQMLAIARALMLDPKLILLDEPTMGLAPVMANRVMDAICEINAGGTTVLLVEQNASAAVSIADRLYIITHGRASCADDSTALDDRLKEAYLA